MGGKVLSTLEKTINEKLKNINRAYEISNLTSSLNGKYKFSLTVEVDPKHFGAVQNVFREVLSELPVDRPVQAKFYLPHSLFDKVKKKATERGVSQSQYVITCIANELRKEEEKEKRWK